MTTKEILPLLKDWAATLSRVHKALDDLHAVGFAIGSPIDESTKELKERYTDMLSRAIGDLAKTIVACNKKRQSKNK